MLIYANNLKCESVCPFNYNSVLYMKKNNLISNKEYYELYKKHNNYDYKNVYYIDYMIFS